MLIDIRERALIRLLPTHPVAQLPIADIWIGLSGEEIIPGGVLAERKTLADFQASFLDGRYREQRTRLLAFCQEKKVKPLYILEGDLNHVEGRIGKQALLKLITRLTLRYGISVLQVADLQGTADLCNTLETQIKEDPKVFIGEIVSYTEVMSSSKRTNRSENLGSAMLQQCPGISAKSADAILEHYKTFAAVITASETDLANLKVGARRLGPVIAKRLWDLFHTEEATSTHSTSNQSGT
jgi:ERCC4-type nuclease